MKQRCSIPRIMRTCILGFGFLLILGCMGCGKPPMFHVVARNEQGTEGERFKIFLKGGNWERSPAVTRSLSMPRGKEATLSRRCSRGTSRSEFPGFADG